ncbi:Hypothetical protein PBC10988_28670 [Planctomycetales bacterium 10988]|nr:Hypothetical protein PBC10988_28670 [Planctomycetales bacterium 10988]
MLAKRLAVPVFVLAIGSSLYFAQAQPPYSYAPPYNPGYYGGYGGYRASTAGEGYARGMASLIQSAGEANLLNSQAAINREAARSDYIDNRQKWTSTYFEMRKMNRAYRAEERGPAPSQEAVVRWAQVGVPDRLSASDLDPLTGQIDWPRALMTEPFDGYRNVVEDLYEERAQSGVATGQLYYDIQQVMAQMIDMLKANLDQYPTNDYIEAKKFLESLAYEAQFSDT